MANGDIDIHDPISNHNIQRSTDCDPKSTSDTSDMEDTPEFRILMAYATRRRPKKDKQDMTDANGTAQSQTLANPEEKVTNKKKKGWKRVLRILKCVKPQTEEDEPYQTTEKVQEVQDVEDRCHFDEVEKEDALAHVASKLTKIANEIPFTPPEVEADCDEDNVEKLIGLILRETGDKLNEKELRDVSIAKELFWNYSFFKRLVRTLLTKMGLSSPNPDSPGPHASPKTQIAVTCEAASRLSALDTLPMNQLLGFGARYLNENFSSWAQQQGGYEAAFEGDDDDDEDES